LRPTKVSHNPSRHPCRLGSRQLIIAALRH